MKFALRGDIIRRKWPPKGGWIYHESSTGWIAPTPMTDNFDTTVDKIIKHRSANRAYNLSTMRTDVESELMHQTAQRIIQTAPEHVEAWVVAVDEEAKKKSNSPTLSQPRPGAGGVRHAAPGVIERLLSRVRGIARGAATLADWIGDGAVPVSVPIAERRAATCANCPLNRPAEDFAEIVTGSIADAISSQTIVKNAIGLSTAVEDKLGYCDACGCPLRLKVWVPHSTIAARTDESTMEDFDAGCWIRSERRVAAAAGKPKPIFSKVITIQRKAAFGDVIMATIVATKVREQGIGVKFITEPIISKALDGHPDVSEWADEGHADVMLDRTYEDNLERSVKDIPLLMLEAAQPQLARIGITLSDMVNRVPVLGLSDDERFAAAKEIQDLPRPRIVLVDGSGSWTNRTWKRSQVESFPSKLAGFGKVIWSKPEKWVASPDGVSGIQIRNFRHLMAIISQADIVVSPDTGPIHVAAAFNKPIIALEQCNDTHLRLSNLTDWTAVYRQLDCLRCSKFECPIDLKSPPCQDIDASIVAAMVRIKWGAYTDNSVSAIIPVLNRSERLERCLEAIIPQVKEAIVVLDGEGSVSDRVRQMGVRVIPSTGERIGYGKSIMRAARQSSHRFMLMLNDDCFMDPGSVKSMKDVMADSVGVVGCLLRYPDGTIQHGGQYRPPGVIGFGHIDHRKRVPTIKQPMIVESVTFASALVRREAFYAVRGFDEVYDCYSEDTDLCMKMNLAGWKIVYQPMATGIHDESQSSSPLKRELLHQSGRIFVRKWTGYLSSREPIL